MERPNSRMSLVRHELFSDIVTHVEALLKDLGLPLEVADQAAVSVADFLADHWGGQYVVIPKDYQFKIAQRDLEMYRSHKGDFSATARQWGMTERGARKVIERVTKRLIAENQGRLFDELV
ncbi:MAG: Mor transcription activator family protein [Ottowia sp.]|uniref:Mor transcription activator family protein n=1 Tax=Ottowia sp. TaxID=1898956 RepID=UPI003C751F89